jgi:paraquat-inducible protein B
MDNMNTETEATETQARVNHFRRGVQLFWLAGMVTMVVTAPLWVPFAAVEWLRKR